ncbi:DUF7386 family protein [Natrinema salaciae]
MSIGSTASLRRSRLRGRPSGEYPARRRLFHGPFRREVVAGRLRPPRRREAQREQASEIVRDGPDGEPPTSDVIDAVLTHLIESEQHSQVARDEHHPNVIQSIANTSVIGLRYRTRIESRWRQLCSRYSPQIRSGKTTF